MNARSDIRIEVLPPVPADELGSDAVVLTARVKAAFEAALRES